MAQVSTYEDLLSTLKNLGYKKQEAKQRADYAISRLGHAAALEQLVKVALKYGAQPPQEATAGPTAPLPEVRLLYPVKEAEVMYDDEDEVEYEEETPPPPRRRRARTRAAAPPQYAQAQYQPPPPPVYPPQQGGGNYGMMPYGPPPGMHMHPAMHAGNPYAMPFIPVPVPVPYPAPAPCAHQSRGSEEDFEYERPRRRRGNKSLMATARKVMFDDDIEEEGDRDHTSPWQVIGLGITAFFVLKLVGFI